MNLIYIMKRIKALKLNMSQIFKEDGTVVPVTWLESSGHSLKENDVVTVVGYSKGRGFSGVMKRHNFRGGPATHGQSDRARAPGSIGGTTEISRVLKGKKMAGLYGNKRITLKNKLIVKIDGTKFAVVGPVPGSKRSIITVLKKEDSSESKDLENKE